jgi:hypothetical protein
MMDIPPVLFSGCRATEYLAGRAGSILIVSPAE